MYAQWTDVAVTTNNTMYAAYMRTFPDFKSLVQYNNTDPNLRMNMINNGTGNNGTYALVHSRPLPPHLMAQYNITDTRHANWGGHTN